MFRKNFIYILLIVLVLLLSACQSNGDKAVVENGVSGELVTINDKYGQVTVPKNPKRVVVLDNRSFETLESWGVKISAVPKAVMDQESAYVKDDGVQDIGDHKEPKLELIASINPDLVIIGQRFSNYYEDIKALVPNAKVIDLDIDLTENAETPGKNLEEGLKELTGILGKIFDKKAESDQLIQDFESSLSQAKEAYKGDSVMSIIVSGGKIRFAAPKTGRVWGPLYELMDWKSSMDIDGSSADHKGDDISVEAIAQSNPDWLFVLDRDAAVASVENAIPAEELWTKDFKREKSIWDETAVIGVTPNVYNDTVSVSKNSKTLTPELKEAIANAFIELAKTPEGKEVISIYSHEGYQKAKSEDYDNERKAQEVMKEINK